MLCEMCRWTGPDWRDADILPQLLCSCDGVELNLRWNCSYALMFSWSCPFSHTLLMSILSYSTHALLLLYCSLPCGTSLHASVAPIFCIISLQLCIANSPCCTTLPFDLRHARSNSCGSNCSSPACVKNKIKLFRAGAAITSFTTIRIARPSHCAY
jgi:hypothetical protein